MIDNPSMVLLFVCIAVFALSSGVTYLLLLIGGTLKKYSPFMRWILGRLLAASFILLYAAALKVCLNYFCGHLGFSKNTILLCIGFSMLIPPIFFGVKAQANLNTKK
jgi:hypothetical protein